MTPVTFCPANTRVHSMSAGVSVSSSILSKYIDSVHMHNACSHHSDVGACIAAAMTKKHKRIFEDAWGNYAYREFVSHPETVNQ